MPKINEEKLAQALAVEKAAEELNQPKMVINRMRKKSSQNQRVRKV